MYKFLARYVRKVYPDTDIKKDKKLWLFFHWQDNTKWYSVCHKYTKEWSQCLGPNCKDETVGCGGAWRKRNKIMTVVYWRERKEKRARYESMEWWGIEIF
jgi:hypothetical protein